MTNLDSQQRESARAHVMIAATSGPRSDANR